MRADDDPLCVPRRHVRAQGRPFLASGHHLGRRAAALGAHGGRARRVMRGIGRPCGAIGLADHQVQGRGARPRSETGVQELALFQALEQKGSDHADSMAVALHGRQTLRAARVLPAPRGADGERWGCPCKQSSMCHTTERCPGYELWRRRIRIGRAPEFQDGRHLRTNEKDPFFRSGFEVAAAESR